MTDFSKTINLPKTVFAMKANLSETENLRTEFWKEKKVYQTLKKKVRMKKNTFFTMAHLTRMETSI